MASGVFNRSKAGIMSGTVDLDTNTIQVMLTGTAVPYTFDADTDFVSDLVASEIAVTNYTSGFSGTGRKTLASPVVSIDDTNDRGAFDAADVTWTALGAGATIDKAILYKRGTADADSILIACYDLTDTPTNGGDITIVWNATGLLTVT